MTMAPSKDDIFAPLNELHAAQEAHDVDAMLSAYSPRGSANREGLRVFFENLIEQDAFKTRTVDWSESETFLWGDYALVKPVTYHTPSGPRWFSYHLVRDESGKWLIGDNFRSLPRDGHAYTLDLIANAGKVVGFRGMVWERRIEVPVERVWKTISTKKGLDSWFLTRNVEIDLRPGGLFKHYWTNTVRDIKEHEYIDFIGVPSDPGHSTDNLMRFAVKPDGEATLFSFYDSYNGAPNPFGVAWNASGWHGIVDGLEIALTERTAQTNFGLGGEFYWRYLQDYHKLADMTSKLKVTDTTAEDWRQAYLADSL